MLILKRTAIVLCVLALTRVSVAQQTPLPVVSTGTVALHMDADVGVTSNANGVAQWTAVNNNTVHFSRITGDASLVAGAMNGQSVIRFNSANGFDRLLCNLGNALGLTGQQLTIFAVTQNTTSLNGLLDSNSTAGSSLRYAFGVVQIPSGTIFSDVSADAAGSVSTFRLSLKDDPSTGPTTLVRTYETFLRSDTFDGPLDTDYATNNSLPHEFGLFDIGTINNGTLPSANVNGNLNGDVAELIIYNGTLSNADRTAVQAALATAYAVPEPTGFVAATICLSLLGPRRTRRKQELPAAQS